MNSTDPSLRFRLLDQRSVPGSRFNEDGCGLRGRHAWVIDGATGLTHQPMTRGASDAAWLAGLIGETLERLSQAGEAADQMLGSLEASLAAAFDRATAHLPGRQDDHAPSACLGLLEAQSSGDGAILLHGCFLGDVAALVRTDDGVERWTDERAKPFERKTIAALGTEGHEPGRIPEHARRQILDNRTRLNRADGYWVVSPRRPWAGRQLRFQSRIGPGAPIVLATDGFLRLVDVFGVYTDATLHARLAAGKGDELVRELRELERSDPMAKAYARVKTHDDATVLVLTAEPCAG